MIRQNSSNINWQFLLLGLFYIFMQCDARAVNVSNTWTMPQEGLNVFYRFFRDRISWFEADAVCQFHHANLVTVDNSFQFDATRDLLRELDVNDIVWIGLMRPQSSDRFMWSNSRALVADTGYWAESLPLMDAPLCAVIDPIRDYRWHALRCGGPETASFLCEMPVPSWADACNLKDMPNLTLQYMADTASIELIRNCQEEGLLRTMCRGKQDRERALQDLICPRERLEAQRINDITNSHFKSLQIINSIPSDNNENNDIELLPLEINYGPHYPEELQTEKNTVQRLIEQFNVDELMQADEPSNMETVSSFYKIPGLIPKPVKKSAKKVVEYPKKENSKQKSIAVVQLEKDKKRLPVEMDEMMMGDQAHGEPEMPEQFLSDDVSNEIMEPLPHIKKTNIHKEDMEKMEKEAIALKESMQKSNEMAAKKMTHFMTEAASSTTTTTTSTTTTTTTEEPTTTTAAAATIKTEEDTHKHHHDHAYEGSLDHLTTTVVPATIGHPMHPQQPRNNLNVEEIQHPHNIKESPDNSHFIPPMLMVKSHYVPSSNKHGHNEHHHQMEHLETITEDPAEPAIKHEQNHTHTMVVTTPSHGGDLKDTQQKQSEKQIASIIITGRQEEQTTTDSGSITPITEHQHQQQEEQQPPQTEQEQRTNSRNLNFEEIHTTMTITTLQPTSLSSSQSSSKIERTTLQTHPSGPNGGGAGGADDDDGDGDETQELKPQTLNTDRVTDTTETTKLDETTETTKKLYELVTEHIKTEKQTTTAAAAAVATTTTSQIEKEITTIAEQPQQQMTKEEHVPTEKEKTKEHDKQQPQKIATTEIKVAPAELQQQQQTTTQPDIQTETSVEMKKLQKTEPTTNLPETDEDKKETIKTTTDILKTSSSTSTTTTTTTTTTLTPSTTSTTSTTTTTVKPITITTKQNVDDATTNTFTTSTSTPNTSPPPPTPTSSENTSSSTTTSTTTTAATTFIPSSSSTPTPLETTTRNFLKVTTEVPYKPNRRRSLTKPETVSYMKKILG